MGNRLAASLWNKGDVMHAPHSVPTYGYLGRKSRHSGLLAAAVMLHIGMLGAILSYLILAIPIFANLYDNLKPEELSQLISTYSFICNYLVYL